MERNNKFDGLTLKKNHLDLLSSFTNHMIEEHKYELAYGYAYDVEDEDYYDGLSGLFNNDKEAYDEYCDALKALRNCSNKLYGRGTTTRRGGKSLRKKNKSYISSKPKSSPARKSKVKTSSMLDSLTDEAYIDYVMHEDKLIYYYRDLYDPYDVQVFNNMAEFSEFLDTEGISISQKETEDIMSRGVSHCCIDPLIKSQGELEIKSERSYGDLRFECAESEDDLSFVKH